jgi:phosphohistidine phosphatase
MKTLLLLRHGKSVWDDSSLDDHERPLTKRGVRAAARMGELLRDEKLLPDRCITSTAVRARHTAWLAAAGARADFPITEVPELYDFGSGQAIRHAIIAHGGTCDRLLVVGHNPSIEKFANSTISIANSPEQLAALRDKYPTAALSVISYDIEDWTDLPENGGRLEAFWKPRDLS